MDFSYNQNTSKSAFKMSKASLSELGPGFIIADKESTLNSSGIYERSTQDDVFNNAASPSETGLNSPIMTPHKCDSSKMQKHYPFENKNALPSSNRITGKRSRPPEDIIAPVSPPKRCRVDAAQTKPPAVPALSSSSASNTRPKIAALLPIQHDSWYYLPEMWDYCGPDGNPIRARRWSPNKDGDTKITHKSDLLREDGDREDATAVTVATWVELNRLRARYAELLAEFHGAPLQVHHLADEASEQMMEAMEKASRALQKAMEHVGMAPRPQPPFRRPAGLALVWEPTMQQTTQIRQDSLPATVSPRDTYKVEGLPKAVGSAQPPAYIALSDILPASSVAPYFPEPPKRAAPVPTLALSIPFGQQAPTAAVPSASKGHRQRQGPPPTSDRVLLPAGPSTSAGPLYFSATDGQFRFTTAGKARFKHLIAQGDYNKAFEMLPEDQQFEHLTTPDAISAFRAVHPRKRGEGNAVEKELWVCRAKVKIERKELPKAKESDHAEYEFEVVYSDEPCNGAASTHSNMVRHKKRTHLGRLYQ